MRSVLKTIQNLDAFWEVSPGGRFELLKKAYSIAKQNRYLVTAKEEPKRTQHGRYSVELEAYGVPANPTSEQVPFPKPVL